MSSSSFPSGSFFFKIFDPRTNTVISLCAIDNLCKGASGGAVQAANADILARADAIFIGALATEFWENEPRATGDGVIDLPGVMSRKKQIAPALLAIL